MPDEFDLNQLPQATPERKKRLRVSVVWIIPILAAVIALGIAIQRLMNEGPTITIVFKGAQGIEAGKSFIKFKDVTVGEVTAVQLSPDYTRVVVKAKMQRYASGMLVKDTTFWVVSPRVTLSGVSALGTLLSGNYIGMQPGKSPEHRRDFTGLDVPPTITDQPGRQFVLAASTLGSIGVGAPVYYRSLGVGQVLTYALAGDGKSIDITVFVNAPYDRYVTSSARFWNASGIEVSAGAEGVKVQTESLIAVLAGGVAFDTPEFLRAAQPAAANTKFTLYQNETLAMKQPELHEQRFVLYFDQSVRGLSLGAPVTLFGLTVGQVTDVGLQYDPATLLLRPRVLITFFPQRVVARLSAKERAAGESLLLEGSTEARLDTLRRMIEHKGLRAQLQTGNLLLGELYVAFEYHPGAPKAKFDLSADPPELPVAPGGLASLQAKLDSILTKVDHMPLEAMGTELKEVLAALNTTLKEANTMLSGVNAQLLPETAKTMADLHRAISNGDQALFGKESPGPQDLRDTLQEMARAARAVRVLVDYLQTHPEALIRGKSEEKP
jgi:paraquat-inducible protein B